MSTASLQPIFDTALQIEPDMDARKALAALGEPEAVTTEPVRNPHRPLQIDHVRTLIYPGLSVTVYDATALDRSLITSITVTKPGIDVAAGLYVGQSKQDALRHLPEAVWQDDATATARLFEDGPPHEVVASFEGDHVSAVAWLFYID